MNLHWLEDILALLDTSSLTAAAERRYITQPAFSRRIRQAEQWFGSELIDRRSKPAALLPQVAAEEEELRDLLSRIYRLRHRLQMSLPSDKVVYIVQHTLAMTHFPALAKTSDFTCAYNLLTAGNQQCVERFRREGDFLLCFESTRQPSQFSANEATRSILELETLVPVAVPQIAASIRANRDVPLLMYQHDSFLSKILAEHCLPTVLRDYNVRTVCETALAAGMKQVMCTGLGAAWIPRSLVAEDIDSGLCVSLEDIFGSAELNIVLYQRIR